MNETKESMRKMIGMFAVIAGILIMFPAVQADELVVAHNFQYPLGDGSLKEWSYFTSNAFGFGKWNNAFGGYHLGQDTKVDRTPTDTKFYAVADGIVRISDDKSFGGYGNYNSKTKKQGKGYAVVIEHLLPDGSFVISLYGHIQSGSDLYNEEDEIGLIPAGTSVRKGQYLGKVADYLMKSGANWHHLHFGIREGAYDQKKYADYIAGYATSGWNEDQTEHDVWDNPNDFILGRIPPSINLVFPNGGENLEIDPDRPLGNLFVVSWDYDGDAGQTVKIELLNSCACESIYTITDSTSIGKEGRGSFVGLIPADIDPGNYIVRITSNEKPEFTDTSYTHFTISIKDCSVPVLSGIETSDVSIGSCFPSGSSKLDLIFLVDTTRSMWDDIANVKTSASEIADALDSEGLDYRVAIADYRDKPQLPYGGSEDYVYNLRSPFSNDRDAIISSINGLDLGWGADEPESVYSALVHSMEDPNKDPSNSANFGWRNGATKAIIIMADAPPHTPEPWTDGHTLEDVISTSLSIDPVMIFSIVIGSSSSAYHAFDEISSGTDGRIYTSPTASDIVEAIIEAIGDIGETPENRGVSVDIVPSLNEVSAGNSISYSVNVTNIGSMNDTYDISIDLNNFVGFQRAYPVAIQSSWLNFNAAEIALDPGISETRSLTMTVPQNWAGMEDASYNFNATVTSIANSSITNTSLAELKIKADKRSMAEYVKLEIQWLKQMVQGATIDEGIKNALLAKLDNAESKVDMAISNIGNEEIANENLNTAENVVNAFTNQVEAQYDKKVMQPDADQLKEKAEQIITDLQTAENN